MTSILRSYVSFLALLTFVLLVVACGGGKGVTPVEGGGGTGGGTGGSTGGSGGGTGGGTGGGSNIVVIVTSDRASTFVSGPIEYTATVTGATSNSTVTWSVQGGAIHGTIDQDGVYTAPLNPGTYIVIATSNEDPAKVGAGAAVVNERASLEFFGTEIGQGGPRDSIIHDLSDDGSTAVGMLGYRPAYWTENSGWRTLAMPSGQTTGYVLATSGAGNWMVGVTDGDREEIPVVWSKAGEVLDISLLNETFNCFEPFDISNNGRSIVGYHCDLGATRWRRDYGFDHLDGLSMASSISGDGRVIGGYHRKYGFKQAAKWVDEFHESDIGTGVCEDVLDLNYVGTVTSGITRASGQFYNSSGILLLYPRKHFDMSGSGTWTLSQSGLWADRWTRTIGFENLADLLVENGYEDELEDLIWYDGFVSDSGKIFVGVVAPINSTLKLFCYIKLP